MAEKLDLNALAVAEALEAEYLAVANGSKKPGKMDLEPMARAVQVIRELERASQTGSGEDDRIDAKRWRKGIALGHIRSHFIPLIDSAIEWDANTVNHSKDQDLRDALSDYETMRDSVGGCSDGGCLVKKPTGMHTNGGCKCHKDAIKAARMMWAGSKLFDAARASLDGRREG